MDRQVESHGDLTVSSRLIAELVGSRHDSIKLTMERLARRGIISQPVESRKKRAGRYSIELLVSKTDGSAVVKWLMPKSSISLDSAIIASCAGIDPSLAPSPSKTKNGITRERLQFLVDYDAQTGIFTWLNHGEVPVHCRGMVAGCMDTHGYLLIRVDGFQYRAHRLAWLYTKGSFPELLIDHINGDKLDNRIANLRDVSSRVNSENIRSPYRTNKSKLLGAHYAGSNRWNSSISVRGKIVFLGHFPTPEEANSAYLAAKRRLHEGFVE